MATANVLRNQLREEASTLLAKEGKGTIVADMGSGKSWIALDSVLKVSSNFPSNYVIKILITSPRTNLKDNWRTELKKFGFSQKTEEVWVHKVDGEIIEYEVTLENVQTAYKWSESAWIKFDIIIADEIHTMMTDQYGRIFNVPHKYLFGFTGTPDDIKEDKAVAYETVAPVLMRYHNAADDGMINKRKYILFQKPLLSVNKMSLQIRKKIHLMGEFEINRYYNNLVQSRERYLKTMTGGSSEAAWTLANRVIGNPGSGRQQKIAAFAYKKAIRERAEFLYSIPSNVGLVKILISKIHEVDSDGKVLVFSKRNEQIVKICGSNVVYQKNNNEKNAEVIQKFNNSDIQIIGSCESLTLGLNLVNPKYAIVESFTGSATETLQKLGRTNRLDKDDVAINTFIVPKDSQAVKWFESFLYDAGLSYSDFEVVRDSNEFKRLIAQ